MEREQQVAKKCKGCGRFFLAYTDRRGHAGDRSVPMKLSDHCRLCIRNNYRQRTTAYKRDGNMLEDVRAGTWRPGPELEEMLAEHGEEISECPGCGKIRRRLVGQWCGGVGCEKQKLLFGT